MMPDRNDATVAGTSHPPAAKLLAAPVRVINVGLEGFATELAAQGVAVTHVQWSPPAGGDVAMAALLGKLGM